MNVRIKQKIFLDQFSPNLVEKQLFIVNDLRILKFFTSHDFREVEGILMSLRL